MLLVYLASWIASVMLALAGCMIPALLLVSLMVTILVLAHAKA